MTLALQPTLTQAGLLAVISADGDGYAAKVTHLAFGDGGTGGYNPQGNETALRGEEERVPINFSMTDGPGRFRVRGKGEPTALEYWVREVGIILDDGTLLAVWSDPERPITGRGPGAALEFDILLALDALPTSSLEIVVTPGGDNVLTALASITAANAALTNQQMGQRIAIHQLQEAV